MIAAGHPEVSVQRRCELLGLPRSSYYRGPATGLRMDDLDLMHRIDELYLEHPWMGTLPGYLIPGDTNVGFTPLSGDHDLSKVDMVDRLNRKLTGWAAFYKFTDNTARTFQRIDRVVFWKLAHWLARKYRCRIKPLLRKWCRAPEKGKAKTWVLFGISERGNRVGKVLRRLVGSPKMQFRWRNPEINPYIKREDIRCTITSRYRDVAMAMGQT